MRILKLTVICCIAMLLAVGCASEKKVEKAAEMPQPATTKTDTTASTETDTPAAAQAEEITLAVSGMT
jgi:outer membrane murein-binding lipoprotein Lpp